jgi:hypothetical protein
MTAKQISSMYETRYPSQLLGRTKQAKQNAGEADRPT